MQPTKRNHLARLLAAAAASAARRPVGRVVRARPPTPRNKPAVAVGRRRRPAALTGPPPPRPGRPRPSPGSRGPTTCSSGRSKENKLVLLDLEAVWCHWCHVMDETTYRDPAVRRLLADKYIAVQVDQDARPDLANRYEDYGWPATIVFDPDGERARQAARVHPAAGRCRRMLQAFIDDPTPGPAGGPVAEDQGRRRRRPARRGRRPRWSSASTAPTTPKNEGWGERPQVRRPPTRRVSA